jgi:hypothetical protein
MGKSWLVGNTLSLVSNIIIHGIRHTHLSSASLLFIQSWEEAMSSPQQDRRKTFPDISALISQVNEHSTIIEIYGKPYLENCINKFVGGRISKLSAIAIKNGNL